MHKGASEWPSDKQGEEGRSLPWWCGRALVAKLGVSTVAWEVPQLSTLVAAQVGIVAAPHAATTHPGSGLCHFDAAVAYHAVGKGQESQCKVNIFKHIQAPITDWDHKPAHQNLDIFYEAFPTGELYELGLKI